MAGSVVLNTREAGEIYPGSKMVTIQKLWHGFFYVIICKVSDMNTLVDS